MAGGLCAACLLQRALSPDDGEDADAPEDRYRIVTVFDATPSCTTYLAEQDSPDNKYVLLTVQRSTAVEGDAGGEAGPVQPEARVLDRGVTADGRPFVVTEYTPGTAARRDLA